MYDLIITWHTFQEPEKENQVLRANGIPIEAVVQILKMYQCSPSLNITIKEAIK